MKKNNKILSKFFKYFFIILNTYLIFLLFSKLINSPAVDNILIRPIKTISDYFNLIAIICGLFICYINKKNILDYKIYPFLIIALLLFIGIKYEIIINYFFSISFVPIDKLIDSFFINNAWIWQNYLWIIALSYYLILYLFNPLKDKYKLKYKNYYLWLLIIIVFILYSILTCLRHWKFQSYAMDLGGYDQMIWGYSKFKFLPSTIYEWGNLLTDHFEPILLLISPIYWIWKNTYLLLIFQSLWVCIGAYPIFLLTKKILNNKFIAIIMAFGYLFFIGIQDALWYDFHPLTLTPTFIAFILYFLEEKKHLWYWIFIFGLLLCKETTSIYVFFIGLYIFLIKRDWKKGLLTMFIGVFWYILAVKIIMGLIFNSNYKYIGAYENLGSEPLNILKTIFTHPVNTIRILFTPEVKINTWLGIFGSFGFLPLLSPASLIMVLPMLGEKFLTTTKESFYSMWWHYTASITPILIFSCLKAINFINNKVKFCFNFILFSGLIVLFSIITISFVYFSKDIPSHALLLNLFDKNYYKIYDFQKDLYQAISLIPENTSVLTQNTIVPHLSHREKIYDLYPKAELKNTDYVLLSKKSFGYEYSTEEMEKFLNYLLYNDIEYKLLYNKNEVYLFKKYK